MVLWIINLLYGRCTLMRSVMCSLLLHVAVCTCVVFAWRKTVLLNESDPPQCIVWPCGAKVCNTKNDNDNNSSGNNSINSDNSKSTRNNSNIWSLFWFYCVRFWSSKRQSSSNDSASDNINSRNISESSCHNINRYSIMHRVSSNNNKNSRQGSSEWKVAYDISNT